MHLNAAQVQTVAGFLLSSPENTKIELFWHFNDRNSGSKHGEPIILVLFKTSEIQFFGVPLLLYAPVCKVHIFMPKMTLSSLLT